MATINLAPGNRYLAAARSARRRLYFIAVVIILILAGIWTGLQYMKRTLAEKERVVSARLAAVETELSRLQEEVTRITLFEGRLESLSGLLDTRHSWKPVFDGLEKLLPPPVVLTAVKTERDAQTLIVHGYAPDVDQVAQTLASLHSTSDRPTTFLQTKLTDIQRRVEKAPTGEIVSSRYDFSVQLKWQ